MMPAFSFGSLRSRISGWVVFLLAQGGPDLGARSSISSLHRVPVSEPAG
ncbi:hypothetical protein J2S66_001981 [Saccharothrix longispora]|uniref:Uncharacterized protein n=1 Tax=Saccharothrix longispora TaxID=33920 RepID=A0ABU1PSH1_9PSEU|nr:hypothetical protein [Saccharothrix longispora]